MKFINEAGWDRSARVILGILLLVLGWGNIVPGGFGVFLKYFSLIPLITGLVGFCPIYWLLKLKTRKVE
jgi:hypothetical protein